MTLEMACSSNSRVLLAKSWDIWDVHDTELTAFQLVCQFFRVLDFGSPGDKAKNAFKKATVRRQFERISFIEGSLDSSFDLPLHGLSCLAMPSHA